MVAQTTLPSKFHKMLGIAVVPVNQMLASSQGSNRKTLHIVSEAQRREVQPKMGVRVVRMLLLSGQYPLDRRQPSLSMSTLSQRSSVVPTVVNCRNGGDRRATFILAPRIGDRAELISVWLRSGCILTRLARRATGGGDIRSEIDALHVAGLRHLPH